MAWQQRYVDGAVTARRKVGAGGVLLGAGLLIGAIIYFLTGGNPIDYFQENLVGLDSNSITETVDDQETF